MSSVFLGFVLSLIKAYSTISNWVSSKREEGDFKSAVRLVSSEETLASFGNVIVYGFVVDAIAIRVWFSLCSRSHGSCCSSLFGGSLQPSQAVVKFGFRNAFNFICHDKMFATIDQLAPKILLFVHSAYSSSSSLFFGKDVIHLEVFSREIL